MAEGAWLLLTGRAAPGRWPVEIPDLASRLAALPIARVDPPDDALLSSLMVKLFADRQLQVAPEVIRYLSLRIDALGRSYKGAPLPTNESWRQLLLEQAGLALVAFQAFGLEPDTGWFRMSVGAVSMNDIEQMFPRIRALLDGLD